MFNVCPVCGTYSVEKEVRQHLGWQAFAVCPGCGYAHPFLRLPLLVVTGASATGKTALALALSASDTRFIHLESDILWRSEFNTPETDYREYRELWLRLAKNIGQAGRPVILYGSVIPGQFSACLERRYFSQVHTLALVCEENILVERLRLRPAWRNAGSEIFIQSMLEFNRWFIEHASAEMAVLDTGRASLAETAEEILRWAAGYWNTL
ncbi:MAG: hypothetical protein IH586_21200 [Anaerolineaceae bacterium]|nr:hypothetical protein [Anaerolineaceae bacterium]